jgi:hypothetical protein
VRSSITDKLNKFVPEFGSDIFQVMVPPCPSINFEKKYFVTQHTEEVFHKRSSRKRSGRFKNSFIVRLETILNDREEF